MFWRKNSPNSPQRSHQKINEGANLPVYVLEFLLGQYCSSDDPDIIEAGVNNIKHILAENYVRPDEAQKILSALR